MTGLRFLPKALITRKIWGKSVDGKHRNLKFSFLAMLAIVLTAGLFWLPGIGHAQGDLQVSGTVNGSNNVGIQNVSVYATDPGSNNIDFGPTATAADGTYTLGVNAGNYDLHFVPPSGSGYSTVIQSGVSVNSNQTVNIQFAPPNTTYTYNGTLTDQNGSPVPDSSVTLASSATNLSYSGSTDSNGNFTVTVTPGVYDIVVANGDASSAHPDYASWNIRSTNNHINLTAGDVNAQSLQINMEPLTVAVNDGRGNPLSNIPITGSQGTRTGTSPLFSGSGDTTTDINSFSGTTGTDGSFTVLLPQGSFFTSSEIKATLSDQIITSGAAVNGPTTVTLAAAVTNTYSGTLTDQNGSPITNTRIDLGSSATNLSYSATTDNNGNFTVTVTPGTYDIVQVFGSATSAHPDYANWEVRSSGNNINLNSNSISGQTLHINMESLTVTVKDGDGNLLANVPVSGNATNVSSTSPLGTGSLTATTTNDSFDGTTGSDGTYTILLPNGSSFTSSGIRATLADQVITAGVTVNGPTVVTLAAATTHTYSGTFTDQNNSPVPNVGITLASSATNLSYSATTDANGNFTITVTPGTYDIVVANGGATSVDPNFASNWQSRSTNNSINLTTSNVTGQSLRIDMEPLTITVNDANGNPLSNIPVVGSQGNRTSTAPLIVGSSNQITTTDLNSFSGATGSNGSYTVLLPTGSSFTSSEIRATLSNQVITAGTTVNGPTTLVLQQAPPTPPAPTNLTLTTPSPTSQHPAFSWAGVSSATSYKIYRNGTLINTINSGNTSYTDSNAPLGLSSYYVTAVNAGGESGPSNSVSVNVVNSTPVVGAISAPATVASNASFNASASFTYPITSDTHSATWNWGDGNTSTGNVTNPTGSNPGSVSGSHSYANAGAYIITVSVTNVDGETASDTFTIAVSPLTSGSFQTAQIGGLNFDNANFSNVNLTNVQAKLTSFQNVNFTSATLVNAQLQGANLTNDNFTGANLNNAQLQSTNLTSANFTNANLKGAHLNGATLTNVTWSNTICPDNTNSDSHGMTCVGHGGGL